MKITDAATKLNDAEYIKRLESDRAELLDALKEIIRLLSPEYSQECKEGLHPYADVTASLAMKKAAAAIARAEG